MVLTTGPSYLQHNTVVYILLFAAMSRMKYNRFKDSYYIIMPDCDILGKLIELR
jgi:hypothetical protein